MQLKYVFEVLFATGLLLKGSTAFHSKEEAFSDSFTYDTRLRISWIPWSKYWENVGLKIFFTCYEICCTNIEEEVRHIIICSSSARFCFLKWHAAAPFSRSFLTNTFLTIFFDVQNLRVASERTFKDHLSKTSHFKLWKLRLKFTVGLTFVHSFWYSRASYKSFFFFWFDFNSTFEVLRKVPGT